MTAFPLPQALPGSPDRPAQYPVLPDALPPRPNGSPATSRRSPYINRVPRTVSSAFPNLKPFRQESSPKAGSACPESILLSLQQTTHSQCVPNSQFSGDCDGRITVLLTSHPRRDRACRPVTRQRHHRPRCPRHPFRPPDRDGCNVQAPSWRPRRPPHSPLPKTL